MNKTKIGYVDYTWNIISGCKRGCSYCYGRRIRQRFQPDISWDKLIWYDERLGQPLKVKKPSRILVGSMSDIEYWRQIDMHRVLDIVKQCPQHTFLFLTKNGNVYKIYDFPKNCWLGVTTTDGNYTFEMQKDRVKYLSLEPLLKEPKGLWLNSLMDWLIIGGLTPTPIHPLIWIDNILKEADRLKIPVFIKHNAWYSEIRQEFPR